MIKYMTSEEITILAAQLVAEIEAKTNTPGEAMLVAHMISNITNAVSQQDFSQQLLKEGIE